MWASREWTRTEKWVGTAIVLGLLLPVLLLFLGALAFSVGSGPILQPSPGIQIIPQQSGG